MPAVLLERVPLPSLQSYVTLSVVFLASALLYTHHTVVTSNTAPTATTTATTTTTTTSATNPMSPFLPDPGVGVGVNVDVGVGVGGGGGGRGEEGEPGGGKIGAGVLEEEEEGEPGVLPLQRNRQPEADEVVGEPGPDIAEENTAGVGDGVGVEDGGGVVGGGGIGLGGVGGGMDLDMAELMAQMEDGAGNLTLPYNNYKMNFFWVLTSEAWCVWTMVNSAYCLLILLGKLIQAIVFGDLRVSEQQHLKDKFWNFVFYKFIFIFGVMNVQTMEEVVMWVAWFTGLGFFHLLVQLSKDRFEYLSFSPAIPRSSHVKLLSLLMLLMGCSGLLQCLCVAAGFRFGITIFAFMAAECALLSLKTLYVVVRYMIHLWDLSLESVWENRSVYVYYSELIFELSSLFIDFAHHLHMLLWGNIFLSMASLVICMQLRYLFYEFQRRIKRHKNYRRVVRNMQARFPMATQEDLELNADECAICWENMEAARKLPCNHLFHNSCLRSWLEQDTSCPTCRMSLSERTPTSTHPPAPGAGTPPTTGDPPNMAQGNAPANQGTTNHFFHFDASRYVSWLPSFSVEVTHTSLLPGQQIPLQTSQLDSMLRQVQTMFPNFPQQVILDDLRQTRSVEVTIDNILENRLQPGRTIDLGGFRDQYWDNNRTPAPGEQQQGPGPAGETMALPTTVSRTGQMALQAALTQPGPGSGSGSDEVSGEGDLPETQDTSSQDITLTGTLPSTSHSSSSQSSGMSSSSGAAAFGGEESQLQTQGGRFSKSASERMSMLQERKKTMLDQARRRYLSRHSDTAESTSSTPQRTDDELTRRRELMFQATQRRLNSS